MATKNTRRQGVALPALQSRSFVLVRERFTPGWLPAVLARRATEGRTFPRWRVGLGPLCATPTQTALGRRTFPGRRRVAALQRFAVQAAIAHLRALDTEGRQHRQVDILVENVVVKD